MNKQEFLAEYAVARKNTDSVKWDNLKETSMQKIYYHFGSLILNSKHQKKRLKL